MNVLCQVSALSGVMTCDQDKPSVQIQMAFLEHINEWGLSYATQAEYDYRLKLFAKTDAEIKRLNEKQSSYEVGHN
jgi:hypothetical protein